MTVKRATLKTAGAYWHQLIPFKGSNFAGYPTDHPEFPYSTGWMDAEERRDYLDSEIVYVVFSYATPVAWVYADGRRYITNRKYSLTTSCQISRAGLGVPIGQPDTQAYWTWRLKAV